MPYQQFGQPKHEGRRTSAGTPLPKKFISINLTESTKNEKERLILEFSYNKQRCKFLFDSSAQTTEMWKNIVGSRNIDKSKFGLLGLGSQTIYTYGLTVMDTSIKGKTFHISAHVIEPCHKLYDDLLGLYFLLEH
jgi:hypothetical protein